MTELLEKLDGRIAQLKEEVRAREVELQECEIARKVALQIGGDIKRISTKEAEKGSETTHTKGRTAHDLRGKTVIEAAKIILQGQTDFVYYKDIAREAIRRGYRGRV